MTSQVLRLKLNEVQLPVITTAETTVLRWMSGSARRSRSVIAFDQQTDADDIHRAATITVTWCHHCRNLLSVNGGPLKANREQSGEP